MNSYLLHHSKISLGIKIHKQVLPDPYNSKSLKPTNNFVISRNINGSTLSLYGDDIWDFTPYKTTNNTSQSKIYFSSLCDINKKDAKWIIFIMLYMNGTDRHSRLSVNSIVSYMKIIRNIEKYIKNNNISIIDLFESKKHLNFYIYNCNGYNTLKLFSPIMKNIVYLGYKKTGINAICGNIIEEINKKRTLLKNEKQYPVIPPRIFSYYITFLHEQVTEFLKHTKHLYAFIKIFHNRDPGERYSMLLDFEKYTKKYNLAPLFEKYNITETRSVSRILSRIQHCCKTLIHIYTGMRNAEAYSLKIDCIKYEKTKFGKTVRLVGETSKLVGQRKVAAWITSVEIDDALKLAQWVAKSIAELNHFDKSATPLFVSTSYLNLASGNKLSTSSLQVNSLSNKKQEINNYIKSDELKIKEVDITFLEKVDPFRSWQDEENFQLNTNWRFTTHQFRRSLAFYAAQSSLVSLPSLKRQLKHITQEMTIYYANGTGFFDLFSGEDHFYKTFINTKPEADALAYLYDVILCKEPLYGAHGVFVDRNISNEPWIIEDRTKLVKRFKKGEIAYTETPLGGCTTMTPCNKKVLREISACFSCSRTVIKPIKLNKVIERQKQLVGDLKEIDSSSFEYKMEKSELTTLLKFQKKITT